MKVSDVLKKAKALIDSPKKWTQKVYARDTKDMPVPWGSSAACKFCALGAVNRVVFLLYSHSLVFAALECLQEASNTLTGKSVAHINDTTDHATVMSIYDKAIQRAEELESES